MSWSIKACTFPPLKFNSATHKFILWYHWTRGPLLPGHPEWENSSTSNTKSKLEPFCLRWWSSTVFHASVPLYLILGIPVILWVALLICDASQVKEYDRTPGEPLVKMSALTDLGVRPAFLQIFRWFYCTARVENHYPLALCHFPLACGAVQGSSSPELLHPTVCPNQPWATVSGLLTNPRGGCCTSGLNTSQIYTVSCAGESHWVFKLKLGYPITTHDYLRIPPN